MESESLIASGINFLQAYPIVGIAILVVVGLLVYWQTKVMLKLVAVCLALGVAVYVFTFLWDLTSSGIDETEKFMSAPQYDVN